MSVPATILLPVFILGVLAIDLTFDIGGLPADYTVTYYAGHRAAQFPANLFVIAGIVAGVVPLVRALKAGHILDISTLVVCVAAVGVFVGYLIPAQVRLYWPWHRCHAVFRVFVGVLESLTPQSTSVVMLLYLFISNRCNLSVSVRGAPLFGEVSAVHVTCRPSQFMCAAAAPVRMLFPRAGGVEGIC